MRSLCIGKAIGETISIRAREALSYTAAYTCRVYALNARSCNRQAVSVDHVSNRSPQVLPSNNSTRTTMRPEAGTTRGGRGRREESFCNLGNISSVADLLVTALTVLLEPLLQRQPRSRFRDDFQPFVPRGNCRKPTGNGLQKRCEAIYSKEEPVEETKHIDIDMTSWKFHSYETLLPVFVRIIL